MLAAAESSTELAEVYRRLASVEDRHAELWQTKLREAGHEPLTIAPGARVRFLGWLALRFGADTVLPFVLAGEAADIQSYETQPEARAAGLPADERSHGHQSTILLTGLAGLLAGAISMALGEWLSVQSSREVYARQIAIEKEELEAAPAEELEELALIYQAKGIPADRARELASSIIANPRTALDTLAREELGIDPQGLGGSAWVAAGTSFALFAAGALVPLLPYVFTGGTLAVMLSGALAAIGLFASGALGSFFTGQPVLRSGVRQAAFGMAAAGITFALGKLVGTGLGL